MEAYVNYFTVLHVWLIIIFHIGLISDIAENIFISISSYISGLWTADTFIENIYKSIILFFIEIHRDISNLHLFSTVLTYDS